MYIFKTSDLEGAKFLKRSSVWRFKLCCGGRVFTACFAADQNEVLADSSEPLHCPECEHAICLVELRCDKE